MKKISLFLIILVLFSGVLAADYDISAANQAYKNQNYQKAEEIYKALVDKGVKSYNLFYNLGNAYFKMGKKAEARLYYEKAARYKPLNRDLQHNLQLLKSTLKDKEVDDKGFLENLAQKMFYFFSSKALGFLTLLFFVILMLLISALVIYRGRKKRQLVKILLAIVAVLFLLFLLLTVFRLSAFHKQNSAVIMADTVLAYSGPSRDFQQVFTVHAGLKVIVEKQNQDWSLIKLPSGLGGWIRSESLKKI